ncbi:MAG: DUF2877 domain-containing protein [Anaerolineales bacterium]
MPANPTSRLRASLIAPRAKTWLAQTRQAHVLHSFEHVINLVNQEAEVLALASWELGAGPFTLVLEAGPFPTGTKVDSPLLVFENGFWIGDWLIDAEGTDLWQPTPHWESARNNRANYKWTQGIITALLNEHAPPDSLARLVLNPLGTSALPARIQQVAEQNIPMLLSGIAEGNLEAVRKASKELAGLGPGLTPAGDDLLLGVMHALWATRPDADSFSQAIARAATPRTHVLSAAWLTAAAAGEAAEPWHALLGALAAPDKEKLEAAVLRILPTGHTSGADALAGFVCLLQLAS